jgi:hypothetical protein
VNVEMTVQFRTPQSLRQEDGMKLWGFGEFKSLPGKCAYQLSSRGVADTLQDAVEAVCDQIREVCDEWPRKLMFADGSSVDITGIQARSVGPFGCSATTADTPVNALCG